jgi:NCS2 family nucleobase:cation symporter-2
VVFALLAVFPKISAFLAVMPRAVIVPSLLFTVTFIIINGLQVITSRLFDPRRTILVGLSIVAGVAVEVLPSIPAMAPVSFRPIIGSSVVFATVVALGLNLLFRIGVKKKAAISMQRDEVTSDALEKFLETQGGIWGARADIVQRAIFGIAHLLDAVVDGPWRSGAITVEAAFDEFNLDVRVTYQGRELKFPSMRPSHDEILADDGAELLAGYMLRQNADRISSASKGDTVTISFHFEH